MRLRDFAGEVRDLEPPWTGTRWSFVRILRRLDEAGVFRPVVRLGLPRDFAKFDYQYPRVEEGEFTPEQVEEFVAVERALHAVRNPGTEALWGQLVEEDSVLAPYLTDPCRDEPIRWADWMVPVHETDSGRTVNRSHVLAIYGAWQKADCWFTMEKHSFRALLDPTEMRPREVFAPGWSLSLGDGVMRCTVGDSRAPKVFEETNEHAWIRRLYAFREELKRARQRVRRPQVAGWEEGQDLSYDERREAVHNQMEALASEVGEPWVRDQRDFCKRVTGLLELVDHAEEHHSQELVDLLHDDLWTAVDWAHYLYRKDLRALDEMVEPAGAYHRKSLSAVLRPTWHEARQSAERFLEQFVENDSLHSELSLSEESLGRFLDFLTEAGLGAWMLELSQVQEEFAHPTDASLDRRFLHLRSQAILTEAVITSLAERFGTEMDREGVSDDRTKTTYRAFLLGPDREGWRTSVWQCLCERWNDLTRASDAGELAENMRTLMGDEGCLCAATPEHDPVCRAILATVALRHYGAHHFTRDRTLLVRNLGHLMGSVAQTAVFYWNQATTDS